MKNKELKNEKKDRKKVIKNSEVRVISDKNYMYKGFKTDKNYSIFSTLDILNKNNDLFKFTKNTIATTLKTIFTVQEIKEIVEKTNCVNFEDLAKKVYKSLKGKGDDANIEVVASSVSEFLEKVHSNTATTDEDKNFDSKYQTSTVEKRASGPHNLVNQVSTVYGENRYIAEDLKLETSTMGPLFVKFESDNEAIQKISEIKDHINNVYGYNISYSTKKNPVNLFKKTLKPTKYLGKMDTCVSMLYSVAQKLTGSKKVKLSVAKKMLSKEEHNDYLNSKKYEDQSVKKIFNYQKDIIKDVVDTLTTIFMARFVFDAKYFSQIERDLTEQACAKMKTLRISSDPDEDYWINQLIEDRLKVNVSQILTANNITSAEQLLKIYNKNGTVIVNPENVTCLEDLVFALQYSSENFADNKKLDNLIEPNVQLSKPVLKNAEEKVEKQKSKKYIDEVIRKSDTYKKYFEMYLNRLKELDVDFSDSEVKEKIDEIKSNIDKNLEELESLPKEIVLDEENKDKVTKIVAKSDAIEDVLEKALEDEAQKLETLNENSEANFVELYSQEAEKNNAAEGQLAMADVLGIDTKQESEPEQITIEEILNRGNAQDAEEISDEGANEVANNEEVVENLNTEVEKTEEIRDENKNQVVFKTNKILQDYSDEDVKNKITKYLNKLVYGENGKVGVVGELLNYRFINKSTKKTTYASDNERLDDKDLNKANKIRDEKVKEVIEAVSNRTYKYYSNFKNVLKDLTIPKLCNYSARESLNIDDAETFTKRDLKKFLSVFITKLVNEELKQYNIELYTGKKTYKKFVDAPCEGMEVK